MSFSTALVLFLSLGMSGCQWAVFSDRDLQGNGVIAPPPPGPEEDPREELAGSRSLQIKSYDEIKKTFQVLTGINTSFPLNAANLETYYINNKASFPQSNDPQSFGPAQAIAIQNYAAEFCVRTVDDPTLRNAFYAGTPFTQTTQVDRNTLVGTEEARIQLVYHFISKFWKPSSHPGRAEAQAEFLDLVRELYASSPTNDNANGRGIVIGACTAGLSAIAVITQ